MASLSAVAASLRFKAVNMASPRALVPVTTKQFHLNSRNYATINDTKRAADSAHQKVAKKADEGAKTISEAAENLKEKAKNTAEEAWDKVKDTTEKIKDTVVGKSEDAKESIKATAKTVERSMNTKNKN
ncbi:PREDICTED: uncharacterized protein At4g13230 [Tarenaya hassleriana]|uniref:uncharacterized protein At4g13230 n=1 Tax=Tarenaya hassleriana TaxID=28532 RepID=UPI00053C2216|nr:PREDICTED: uncharacterized protein At4g13230 [Tarenaya hassleriana]